MYEQMAIDRISEVENLTDNLTDETASWLIRLAIDKATALLTDINDADAAGAKVNDLMAVMRDINQIIPALKSKQPSDLTKDLSAFVRVYSKAFGDSRKLTSKSLNKLATELKKMSPLEATKKLLTALSPGSVAHPATAKSKK